MPLDFYVDTKDTGSNYDESIQPVSNSESAEETVFRRPSENIRTRTEDIRKQFDLLEAVAASDRGLTIMAQPDAYIEWDHTTGKFAVTDSPTGGGADKNFYIMPLLSTAQGSAGTPPGVHLPATFVYNDSGGGGIFITEAHNTLRDHGDSGSSRRSGANNLFIAVVESSRSTGGVVIIVTGDEDTGLTFPEDGPVLITIELEQGGNTAAEVVAALQAAGDHDTYINTSAPKTKVLVAGDCTKEVTRCRFADGDTYDAGGGLIYRSMGAIDPEGMLIENTALTSFFGTSGNELDEGDVLVVNFTDADDRLNNQTDLSVTSLLKKVSYLEGGSWEQLDSGHVAWRHVIPIAKVFDQRLYLLNGTVVESGKTAKLIADRGDVAELQIDYDAHVAGTADKHADTDVTAAAKSGSPQSYALGTVSSQLVEALADYNAHASDTADKHADTGITAAAKSGSPQSYALGTVSSQLTEALADYNAHVGGSADKHAEGDITTATITRDVVTFNGTDVGAQLGQIATAIDDHIDGSNSSLQQYYPSIKKRPIVTVAPTAGDGDYQTLQAACDAIHTTGGIIVLKAGTYSSGLSPDSGHSLDGPIDIIGEGSPTISFTGTLLNLYYITKPLTFRNVTFTETATSSIEHCDLDSSGGDSTLVPISFYGCIFNRTGTASSTANIFTIGDVTVYCRDCLFQGVAPTNKQRLMSTGSGAGAIFENCLFDDLESLWGSTGAARKIGFYNNTIRDCGYTPSGTTVGILVETTDSHELVEFIGNIWESPGTGTYTGKFCDGLAGKVIHFVGNSIKSQGTITGQTAINYMFEDFGSSTSSIVIFSGNNINTGNLSCFNDDTTADIRFTNNYIYVDGNYTTVYGISLSSSGRIVIAGNYIDMNSSETVAIYVSTNPSVSVLNNVITGIATCAIQSSSNKCGVYSGNKIYCSGTAAVGIELSPPTGDDGISVVGNHIDNAEVGIKTDHCNRLTISANTIDLSTSTSAKGIYILTSQLHTTVNNNTIEGVGVDGQIGIVISISAVACQSTINSNTIRYCDTGIDLTAATQYVCSGNFIYVPNVNGSKGIDCSQTALTEIRGAVTGNSVVRQGNTNTTGSYGIDVDYCAQLACSGNYIGPAAYFATAIYTTNATSVGLGEDQATPNTSTYNLYHTS